MVVARMSRAERKEQTRQALLDAGRELFVREGFHRTTLDRVAAEAGFTKGAVYASFPTKADLFLAIFERRTDERIARIREVAKRPGSLEALNAAMARDFQRVMRDEQAWSLLLIEFWVHAARDEQLRDRLADERRRIRAVMIEAARAAGGDELLEMDVEDFVAAQLALGNGLNLEAFLDRQAPADRLERLAGTLLKGARR
jgi:AcrR family transcriptional regulator